MLPKSLFSTYSQYKADTSAFVTWLSNVAEACGYKPTKEKKLSETDRSESASSKAEESAKAKGPRLKGKERKLAKAKTNDEPEGFVSFSEESVKTVKYGLSSQEMLAQVDIISRSKSQIKLPSGIQKILERAIDARRRCSAWYEATKHDSQFDDDGHQFFITVLQDALSKLKRDPDQEETSAGSRSKTAKAALPKDKALTDLENKFSLLEVEDVDDSFQLSPTEVALTSAKRPTKKQKVDSVDVFELEVDRAVDNAFSVFCFFEDLARIRKQLQKMWKNCNMGKVDLVTATVATQAAISMVTKAEQDLLSSSFGGLSADNSYQVLAGRLMMVEKLTKGIDPMKGGRVDVTPFDDFIFLPAARILFKFCQIAAMSNEVDAKWPAPIPKLHFQYIFQAEKAELPEHKKLQHDDEILTRLLLELQLPDKCKKYAPNAKDANMVQLPQEDCFSRTLRPVWTKGQVSVTAVFTGQVMLDILDASDDPSLCYKHLFFSHKWANDSFDFEVRNGGRAIATRGGCNWPDSGANLMLRVYTFLKDLEVPKFPMMRALMLQVSTTPKMYTWSNTTPEQRAQFAKFGSSWTEDQRPPPEIQANMERMDLSFIEPAPDHDFIFNNNPLFSGSVMLKLLLEYHTAGLSLANHHMSIFVAAHLYNALRQLNMLKEDWPIMERIIELHKRAIFADAVPTKTSDIADRLSYRLDAQKKQKRHFEDGRYKFKEPEATQTFRSLLDVTERNDRVVWQIEQQIESHENTKDQSSAAAKLKAKEAKVMRPAQQLRQLTPEAYVSGAQSALSQTISDLSIDYIGLTKRCITLLDTFRIEWNEFLQAEGETLRFDSMTDGVNSKDISRLVVCYEAFKEAKAVREMGIYTYAEGDGDTHAVRGSMNPDPEDEWRHGMGLKVASRVMKDFLAKKEDFKFPLLVDHEALARVETPNKTEDKFFSWKLPRLNTASEFQSFLSDHVYVVVYFYTDYAHAHSKENLSIDFANLAKKHTIRGVLDFVRANKDDMPHLAAQFCMGSTGHELSFVFFKEGKQVAVNGYKIMRAADKARLKVAAEKLGELAKKREAQMKEAGTSM